LNARCLAIAVLAFGCGRYGFGTSDGNVTGPRRVQSTSIACGMATACGLSFAQPNAAGAFLRLDLMAVGATVTSVSDTAGNTWVGPVATDVRPDVVTAVMIYYVPSARAGPNQVIVDESAGDAEKLAIYEYTGIAAAAPLTSNHSSGTNSAASSGALAVGGPALLVAAMTMGPSNTPPAIAAGGGWSLGEMPSGHGVGEDRFVTDAGNYATAFDMTASSLCLASPPPTGCTPWAVVGAAFATQ
jgi:hypothetical protein